MKNIILVFFILIIGSQSTFCQTLTIDSCIHIALKNNYEIQRNEIEQNAQQEIQKQAFTKYFPTVSGSVIGYHSLNPLIEYGISDIENSTVRDYLNTMYAEYGSALGLPNTISLCQNGLTGGITAVQPIFAGGQIVNGNRLAALGVKAGNLQLDLIKKNVIVDIEKNYWLIISLQEKLKTIQQAQIYLDTLLRDVTNAVDAGLTTQNDILKVKLKKDELSSTFLKLNNGITLSKMALCHNMGIDFQASFSFSDTLISDPMAPEQMFKDAQQSVLQRTEYQLLTINTTAELLKRKMIIGKALPQIMFGIGISYGHIIFDRNMINGLAFASVQIPISAWGENVHKIREQSYQIKKSELMQQEYTKKMNLETEQAWNNLQESFQQINIATLTVENARQNLATAEQNYAAGLLSISELLEAQTIYRQAINREIDEKIAYRIQSVQYKKITQ